jgi:topoisomerase-4 subunit B
MWLGHHYLESDAPARGKKPAQKIYALDVGELAAIEDKLTKDGLKEGSWQISRFKGLGQMIPNNFGHNF